MRHRCALIRADVIWRWSVVSWQWPGASQPIRVRHGDSCGTGGDGCRPDDATRAIDAVFSALFAFSAVKSACCS
jgi:hypothetical protein